MAAPEETVEAQPQQDNSGSQARNSFETDGREFARSGSKSSKSERKGIRNIIETDREPGKSLLPFARVQKIIKADKEIPIVAKEATFLISVATEEFIKRLAGAGQYVAQRENRATVQHRDLATVVRRADEFLFLEDILPWTSADPPAKRQKLASKTPSEGKNKDHAKGPMDQFVGGRKGVDEEIDDVVMDEDGTMYASNTTEFEE